MERTVNIILGLLLAALLVLVLAPGMLSAASPLSGNQAKNWSPPAEVYVVVSAKNVTGDGASFEITGHAMRTAGDRAMVKNFTSPLAGQYYFSNDTAVIIGEHHGSKAAYKIGNWTVSRPGKFLPPVNRSREGRRGPPPGMGFYNNTSLPVAGASAVVVQKNLTILSRENRTVSYQFTDLLVYLPDGTAKPYKLATPVKVTVKEGVTTVQASPEVRSIMRGFMSTGSRFPAAAAPLKLTDIDAKW